MIRLGVGLGFKIEDYRSDYRSRVKGNGQRVKEWVRVKC